MNVVILGGGLSAVSLAYFLQAKDNVSQIIIKEKEKKIGGLCSSYNINGIYYDVGPHIIFSKDKEILELMNNILESNVHTLRRSNRIIHKKKWLQYPFENDLSKLPSDELCYCINSFFNNPYEDYKPSNMLQFFLKTFGEGITNIYLRPYNEKIWKFDPAFMDTQMVERIPKPTIEEIERSANGETVDGYIHQLFFSYPKEGGIESIIKAFEKNLSPKVIIETSSKVEKVIKAGNEFNVISNNKSECYDKVISTIPVNHLADKIYVNVPGNIRDCANGLKYNSIIISIINVSIDRTKDNFAFMNADKSIIFHRISRIDFLGEQYAKAGSVTYMIEITFRNGDLTDIATEETIRSLIIKGLLDIGFIDSGRQLNFFEFRRFEFAYVIYDLDHRKNMDRIIEYFQKEGVFLNGRFGSFEYLNMDAVIRQSKELSERIV